MKKLWKAITDKLKSDSTLVSLTGHTSSDVRIFATSRKIEAKYPSLFVKAEEIETATSTGPSVMQIVRGEIYIFAKKELIVADIFARLKEMFDSNNVENKDAYLNFSNTDICNTSTIYLTSSDIDFDQATDSFSQVIFFKAWFKYHN